MDKDTKEQIKTVKASTWKKVLIWSAAVLGLVLLVGVLVFMLYRKKGPVGAVADIIRTAQNEAAKADVEAKIKVAEAKSVEKVIIDELKKIKEEKDELVRARKLANLL